MHTLLHTLIHCIPWCMQQTITTTTASRTMGRQHFKHLSELLTRQVAQWISYPHFPHYFSFSLSLLLSLSFPILSTTSHTLCKSAWTTKCSQQSGKWSFISHPSGKYKFKLYFANYLNRLLKYPVNWLTVWSYWSSLLLSF